jgi:hypothetical protein
MEKMENVNGNRLRHVFSYFIKNQTPNQLHMMRFAWLIEIHNSSLERDVDKCLMHVALLVLKQTILQFLMLLIGRWKAKCPTFSNLVKQRQILRIYLIWFDLLSLTQFSAISWRPVLVVGEAGVPGENHRQWASNW